jgi:4-amino-4-deoxy-L-arabinose transferase-like glycosyltransferase
VWQWGWTQSEVWRGHLASAGGLPSSLFGAFGKGNRGYIYLVAMLLYPLGVPSRLAVAFLNAFFGALTVVLVYMIAERLFRQEVARIAGILATFFPSLIIWSAQTLKEPVVIFCECLIVYALIRLRQAFSMRYLVYVLLGILLVSTLRFYVAYLALGVLAMTLLTPRLGVSHRSFFAGLLALALAIPLLRWSGFLSSAGEHASYVNLHFIEQFRAGASIGPGARSSIQTDVDVTTPHGAALATVIGVAHLMLAPFPWQLGSASLRMLMTLPELLLWWWLLFRGVLPGLRYAVRRHFMEIQPLLLFIIPLSLLYGLMFTNIGLVFRQRAQLVPFYLIFAGVGLVLRREQQANRWAEAVRMRDADGRFGIQHSASRIPHWERSASPRRLARPEPPVEEVA